MERNVQFKTAELANRIEVARKEILRLYTLGNHYDDARKLQEQLDAATHDKQIRVVFIGQYTAGKSTIISALTANKDIIIDSDIATIETADYTWNGVTLTDTPGLYTENPEHDARTIEMIGRSDLLVYCITSDLFSQYTLQDFKHWAFKMGYAGKMFLIVNKMSKEAGEFCELAENYSDAINRALVPNSTGEFSYSFVDAKDYKDGIDGSDRELVEYSHFEDFIVSLNLFIMQKGLLGKLDTPIMLMKASIDEMTQKVADDDINRAYNVLLSRVEMKVDQQRSRMSVDSQKIIRRGLRPITDKGNELSRMVGVDEITFSEEDINELICVSCEEINSRLTALCEQSMVNLKTEIDEVMDSEAAVYFFNSISSNYDGKMHMLESKKSRFCRAQFKSLRNVIENITGMTIGLATKGGAASAKFLIKSAEASGSTIHKAVLQVGQKLGYKFKPWQAVNISKTIGNVAKFVGPVMTVLGLFFDVKDTIDDQTRAQQLQKAQIKYRSLFQNIVSELESHYSSELVGLFDVYENITAQLQKSRDEVEKKLKSNDEMTKKLLLIKDDLIEIQSEIF